MIETIKLKERKSPLLFPEMGTLKLRDWLSAEDLPTFLEIFAGISELEKIRNKKNQIIFGRRGTGKSHFFKAFNQLITSNFQFNELAIYITCLSITETPPDFDKFTEEFRDKNYADYYFKKFLLELAEKLTYAIDNYIKTRNVTDKDVLKKIDSIIDKRILNEIYNGSEEVIIQHSKAIETVNRKRTGWKIELKTDIISKLLIFLGWRKSKEIQNEIKDNQISYFTTDLSEIQKAINDVLNLLNIDTLYICIDEWAELDRNINSDIQKHFAQKIKRLLFKNPKISVKIASIWHATELCYKTLNASRSGGIEIGQDIYKSLDLDTLFFESEESISHFLSKMIFKRVNYFLGFKLNYIKRDKDYLDSFINEIFLNKENFMELISASHGVPRDFLELFTRCLYKIDNNLDKFIIDRSIIENVAIDFYKNEKRSLIAGNESLVKYLTKIDNYIKVKKVRFFAIESSLYKYSLEIKELVDKKFLQQIPSASIPRELRDKYKVYLIDYGNYCEYIKINNSTDRVKFISPVIEFSTEIILNFSDYVLDIDTIDSDYVFCDNCNDFISKRHPVYFKYKICPRCAHEIE